MKNYINENYSRLKNLALLITKNKNRADDLMSETVLSLLDRKSKVPSEIFTEGKQFLYFYVTMHRMYFFNNSAYNKKYSTNIEDINLFNPYQIDIMLETENTIEEDDAEADLKRYEKYEKIKEFIEDEVKNKNLHWYHGKLFLMYYYPNNFFPEYMNKISYRQLEEKIDINFQSIRLSVKIVENHIKETNIIKSL